MRKPAAKRVPFLSQTLLAPDTQKSNPRTMPDSTRSFTTGQSQPLSKTIIHLAAFKPVINPSQITIAFA